MLARAVLFQIKAHFCGALTINNLIDFGNIKKFIRRRLRHEHEESNHFQKKSSYG